MSRKVSVWIDAGALVTINGVEVEAEDSFSVSVEASLVPQMFLEEEE